MKVFTLFTYAEEAPVGPEEVTAAVVIDVLRAATTVVTALVNGARVVYPVKDLESAFKRYEEFTSNGIPALLGGERNGVKPRGFHLGNSPGEYTARAVGSRAIIFSTTNGTAAVDRMSGLPVMLAAFVNLTATAEYLRGLAGNVIVCCSGNSGRPSYEDIVCAGGIIKKAGPSGADDSSLIARELYETYKDDLCGMMLDRAGRGRRLATAGFAEDVYAAAALDAYPVVVKLSAGGGFYLNNRV